MAEEGFDESTYTADIRAHVSICRENGIEVDRMMEFTLHIANWLRLPDDTLFIPAVGAAMATPTQLDDPASVARTREIAIAAGYGKRLPEAGIA